MSCAGREDRVTSHGAGRSVYIFAGGGTGGHIYPGLAIAEALLSLEPGARCVFVCSVRPLDSRILSEAGMEHRAIPAQPPALRPVKLARFIGSWGPSVRAVRALIRDVRLGGASRVVLAAMGGFVAAPAAQAARAERVPVVLVNLDAAPGKANRWIARRAAACMSATGPSHGAGDLVPADWERVPPIVRAAAITRDEAGVCRARLGLDSSRPVLLVTGGSQGAGSINALMTALARGHSALFEGWQIFHQAGDRGGEDMASAYRSAGITARLVPFWNDMRDAWGAAELAITRAGAGAVGEVWANRVPAIFLPYPYHKDEHQRLNALPLERAGGAVIVRDAIEPGATMPSVLAVLTRLMPDSTARDGMRAALAALGPADGAMRLARRLIGMGS